MMHETRGTLVMLCWPSSFFNLARPAVMSKPPPAIFPLPELRALPAAYARQAKNKDLLGDAREVRKRAERRLGEQIAEQAKTIGLAKGAIIPGTTRGKENPASPPILDKAGIDKNLAKAARAAPPGSGTAAMLRRGQLRPRQLVWTLIRM
jgi:hypothetical protein